jgi:hypothetical protein
MVSGPKLPSAPTYGILERSAEFKTARLVVVAEVPVELVKLKVVRVEEAGARKPLRRAS